jgi:hypothetical protein
MNLVVLLCLLVTNLNICASVNLNQFLVKLTENVTGQMCFVSCKDDFLVDFSEMRNGNPQLIFTNEKDLKYNEKMWSCFLTFVEIDLGDIVRNILN